MMLKTALIVAGAIVGVGVIIGGAVAYQHNYNHNQQPAATNLRDTTMQPNNQNPQPVHLEVTDETVGTGAEAVAGKTVTVNYIGTLTDGTKFDSSYDRNQPFQFSLGAGQVIPGWDQGVVGMKVGGKRKLVIPPDLAYGANPPTSAIPPNATLVFEIELLNVQ